ncbi:MAG: hypothetical protein JW874_02795 [Spirochaetales bacterium]|nr:hypothetical protein [Spirochaetales bacterium]
MKSMFLFFTIFENTYFFGQAETDKFARVTSAGDDYLRYEEIDTGVVKARYNIDVSLDGNDIQLRKSVKIPGDRYQGTRTATGHVMD